MEEIFPYNEILFIDDGVEFRFVTMNNTNIPIDYKFANDDCLKC